MSGTEPDHIQKGYTLINEFMLEFSFGINIFLSPEELKDYFIQNHLKL